MGGLSLGFALAINNVTIQGLDINKYAIETYNLNLNRFNARGSVVDVLKWQASGEFDAIIGGPPCQPFSLANTTKKGESHPYFPTFSRFFDVVLQLKPSVFLLENVKGLLTKKFVGYFQKQMQRVVNNYNVEYQVINAVNYGVPQKRERIFVIGIRKDLGIKPSFPPPTHSEKELITIDGKRTFKWVTLGEAINDIMNITPQVKSLTPKQIEKIKSKRLLNPTSWGTKRETIVIPVKHITEHIMTEKGGWTENSDWGSRVLLLEEPSYTITTQHRSGQLIDVVYRRLTVRETLRIQSFPDWWHFPENISTSEKFRLVGETVPPILAFKLATHIAKMMNWETKEPRKQDWDLPYFERAFAEYGI
jgi:DNA (cytosine-5)-methyltransferase 1